MNGRSRVIGFAHEEISLDDRAGRRLPVCPGRHDFGAAVGILEVQLTLEARVLAVMVALLAEADVAAVPAIRQDRAQGVVPRMNPVGHIIGAVVDPSGVVGPAGVEIIVADALAVEVKVMNSQRGGVDRGPPYGLPHRKGDSKVRRWRKNQLGGFRFCSPGGRTGCSCCTGLVITDPLSLPVGGFEQSHGPDRQRTPGRGLAILVPNLDLPVARLIGQERFSAVDNGRGVVALHLAAVPEVSLVELQNGLAAGHQNLVPGLSLAALGRGDDPA